MYYLCYAFIISHVMYKDYVKVDHKPHVPSVVNNPASVDVWKGFLIASWPIVYQGPGTPGLGV